MNNPHFETYMNNYLRVLDNCGIPPSKREEHTCRSIICKMRERYLNLNTLQTYLNSMAMITGEEEYTKERKMVHDELRDLKEKREYKTYRQDLPSYKDIVNGVDQGKLHGEDNTLIFLLYSLLPPLRLDYADCEIIRSTKSKPFVDDGKNVVEIQGKNLPVLFHLREYKNESKYGPRDYRLPDVIGSRIKTRYFNRDTTEPVYLLMTKSGASMSPKLLGDRIRRIFKYTLNDLRAAYETEKMKDGVYDELNAYEKEKEAECLLHSYGMVDSTYYVRK